MWMLNFSVFTNPLWSFSGPLRPWKWPQRICKFKNLQESNLTETATCGALNDRYWFSYLDVMKIIATINSLILVKLEALFRHASKYVFPVFRTGINVKYGRTYFSIKIRIWATPGKEKKIKSKRLRKRLITKSERLESRLAHHVI